MAWEIQHHTEDMGPEGWGGRISVAKRHTVKKQLSYLLKMPPKSEALRHSGGERRLFTSAIVTLYLEVELRRDKRPGTEQNKSVGLTTQVPPWEGKVSC